MRGRQGKKLGIAGVLALAMLLAAVPIVRADQGTDEYRAQVEPICKQNVQANKRIFKHTEAQVNRGELKKASRAFFRATKAFGRTINELAVVPEPVGYETKLDKWFSLLRKEKSIIKKIGQALAAEKRNKAESFSVDLNRNTNKANNQVIIFGFDYCRLDSSRFG